MPHVNGIMAYPAEASAGDFTENAADNRQRWALKYGDKVYGPYSFEAMKSYVAEGRVAEHSLLAPEGTPAGASMWRYAIDIPLFAPLFAAPEEPSPAEEHDALANDEVAEQPADDTAATDLTASVTQADETDEPRVSYGPGKGQMERRRQPETANFIIVMDIKARFAGPLEQAIMSLGAAYKLAPNVWCVNTDATAAGLLNDLSQHIGRTDSMFIADTTRDRTAWSSMGPEVDAKIRRVWRRTY
jgi:hypothetical protein